MERGTWGCQTINLWVSPCTARTNGHHEPQRRANQSAAPSMHLGWGRCQEFPEAHTSAAPDAVVAVIVRQSGHDCHCQAKATAAPTRTPIAATVDSGMPPGSLLLLSDTDTKTGSPWLLLLVVIVVLVGDGLMVVVESRNLVVVVSAASEKHSKQLYARQLAIGARMYGFVGIGHETRVCGGNDSSMADAPALLHIILGWAGHRS